MRNTKPNLTLSSSLFTLQTYIIQSFSLILSCLSISFHPPTLYEIFEISYYFYVLSRFCCENIYCSAFLPLVLQLFLWNVYLYPKVNKYCFHINIECSLAGNKPLTSSLRLSPTIITSFVTHLCSCFLQKPTLFFSKPFLHQRFL